MKLNMSFQEKAKEAEIPDEMQRSDVDSHDQQHDNSQLAQPTRLAVSLILRLYHPNRAAAFIVRYPLDHSSI